MFADVISRDGGEPWGTTGMTTARWLTVPPRGVPLGSLIATQPGLYVEPLIRPAPPVGGDEYPHVIAWRGRLFLEDGHHRAVRAGLRGRRMLLARVLDVA